MPSPTSSEASGEKKLSLTEAEFKRVRQNYLRGVAFRKKQEPRWRQRIEWFKGEFGVDRETITVNEVLPIVYTVLPSVWKRDPKFVCRPRIARAEHTAPVMEAVLNYYFKRRSSKKQATIALLDWILTGLGTLGVYYVLKTQDHEREEPAGKVRQAIGKILPEGKIKDAVTTKRVKEERVIQDDPVLTRISPFKFFISPDVVDVRDLQSAPYCGTEDTVCYDTLRERYPGADLAELKADAKLPEDYLTDEDKANGNADAKRYTLVTYHDLATRRTIEFTASGEEPLAVRAWPEYWEGYPYRQIENYHVPDEYYPVDEITPIAPQILEQNEARDDLRIHRRRYKRKYLARKGSLDDAAKAQLQEGEDGAVVFLTAQEGVPLADHIQPMIDAPVPVEVFQASSAAQTDIQRITSLNDYRRGGNERTKTATEADAIERGTRLRLSFKQEDVETLMGELGSLMVNIITEKFTRDHYAMVAGDELLSKIKIDGESPYAGMLEPSAAYRGYSYLTFNKDSFRYKDEKGAMRAARYDVSVELGSTLPLDPEIEAQQTLQHYAVFKDSQFIEQRAWTQMVLDKLGYDTQEIMTPEVPEAGEPGGGGGDGQPGVDPEKEVRIEIGAFLSGQQPKARPEQDHRAHAELKQQFLEQFGPKVPPQVAEAIQRNIAEHQAMAQGGQGANPAAMPGASATSTSELRTSMRRSAAAPSLPPGTPVA